MALVTLEHRIGRSPLTLEHAHRQGVWKIYTPPKTPAPRVRIVQLLEASDGALWLATNGQEALRLDLSSSRWSSYEDLSYECETADGARWFLPFNKGKPDKDKPDKGGGGGKGKPDK